MPDRDAAQPRPHPRAGHRTAYAVLAGGSGTRVGAATNKVHLELAGLPVLSWSLRHAAAVPDVVAIVVVARPQDAELTADAIAAAGPLQVPLSVVDGGVTRHGSEQNALAAVAGLVRAGEVDLVAVHDAARPLARPELIAAVLESAAAHGAAIPAVPAPDVVPVGLFDQAAPPAPEPSPRLVAVQTPQVFSAAPLLEVFARAADDGFEGTDTASIWERYAGSPVHVVPSDRANLKVTWASDLDVANHLLSGVPPR